MVKIFLSVESKIAGFKILLSNRESSSFFKQHKFNIDGSHLEAYADQPGYSLYNLKLHEEFHLEDDPLFECRDYDEQDYNSCLEQLYSLQTSQIINCTPPWLTDTRDQWCSHLLHLHRDQQARLDLVLDNIVNNQYNPASCPISCRKTM